jgi:hypothetical protein
LKRLSQKLLCHFGTRLCKRQNFAFALSKSFGILSSLLSPYSPWQTSRLAFAFSQAYVFHIRVSFFTSNTLIHSTQLSLFPQQFSLPLLTFAGGI